MPMPPRPRRSPSGGPMPVPPRPARAAAALALAAALGGTSGCAALHPPSPWEKGHLAKPQMTMGGNALAEHYIQHIYASKEDASGGYGVGGGGCGCN